MIDPKSSRSTPDPERARLAENGDQRWWRWGPYLAERQWGTVREDYSARGTAWEYLPHDHARSRAYRWGEDGLGGFSDREQRLCVSVALWNGADPILKERLFGLTNGEGNHGEDVKEAYWYLDATPTHAYQKMLYRYLHALPLARLDPPFAKHQLDLLTREWAMHPNGQIPAYEWAFGDVNPPVHAWATWRVFEIDREARGDGGDLAFLERVFHKLLLNFTWWVNRKDPEGRNVFEGGFLGLDNIGVFDRSAPLPSGGHLHQSDGTSWMAMYALDMLRISLELALHNPVHQDIATKFFEHFLGIAAAMTHVGGDGIGLWDDEDEFYYDVLHLPDGSHRRLKLRSMVGLIPLYAVALLEPVCMERLPDFARRLEWTLDRRPDLAGLVSRWSEPGSGDRRLLSLLRGHRMKRLLARRLDEDEFLSPYGVRALSRHHRDEPYTLECEGYLHTVRYEPGESRSGVFGGNSNWRGPVWFPVNYLLIESLLQFHAYYGDEFTIECPTGSGSFTTIRGVAEDLARRLVDLFVPGEEGRRPVYGGDDRLQGDRRFRDHLWFFEYFHGDTGRGLGAAHQTGWTALVAELVHAFPSIVDREQT